jgi:membrane protein
VADSPAPPAAAPDRAEPALEESRAGGVSRPTEPDSRTDFTTLAKDFIRRVYKQAEEDNIFFMAGAIAFNVLVAIVPLILAMLGIAGLVLRGRYADPAATLMGYIVTALPGALSQDFVRSLQSALTELINQSGGLLSLGTFFFIWVATRLVGTLRTALREIFDIHQDRGIIAGKIFDIKMVITAGSLLIVNVGLTVVIGLVARYGIGFLGIAPGQLESLNNLYLTAVAFTSIWFMFVLIYRYLPARRIQWRIAMIAATFSGVFFELLKAAFSWYAADIADYSSTYGNFATVIILFLWIYYMSIVFIIGGEVGQVAALQRIRRRQKERLH